MFAYYAGQQLIYSLVLYDCTEVKFGGSEHIKTKTKEKTKQHEVKLSGVFNFQHATFSVHHDCYDKSILKLFFFCSKKQKS